MNVMDMITVTSINGCEKYVFNINNIEYVCQKTTTKDIECKIGLKSGKVIYISPAAFEVFKHAFLDEDDE